MSFRDTHLKKWGLITNTFYSHLYSNSSKPTDKLQNYHPELLPSAPYLHWHLVVSALQQSGQVSESNTVFHQSFVLSVAVRVAVIFTCCQKTTLFKTSRPCTFTHTKKVKTEGQPVKKKNQQGIKCANAVFICITDIFSMHEAILVCYLQPGPACPCHQCDCAACQTHRLNRRWPPCWTACDLEGEGWAPPHCCVPTLSETPGHFHLMEEGAAIALRFLGGDDAQWEIKSAQLVIKVFILNQENSDISISFQWLSISTAVDWQLGCRAFCRFSWHSKGPTTAKANIDSIAF